MVLVNGFDGLHIILISTRGLRDDEIILVWDDDREIPEPEGTAQIFDTLFIVVRKMRNRCRSKTYIKSCVRPRLVASADKVRDRAFKHANVDVIGPRIGTVAQAGCGASHDED